MSAWTDWVTAFAGGTGVGAAAHVAVHIAGARLRSAAVRTRSPWDDALAAGLQRGAPLLAVAAGGFALTRIAPVSPVLQSYAEKLLFVAVLAQAAWWAGSVIRSLVESRRASAIAEGRAEDAPAWNLLGYFVRAALWLVVGLTALDGLGFDVTALMAGVGIGGIAIGLAVQSVLGDVLASLSIVLDRPFVIGDFLEVDGLSGTVEHVGLKTTRVRSLSGEQLVFSNADLLGSRIRNYQRLTERRVLVPFGVLYETPADALERIPLLARAAVDATASTRFDRAHVVRFGDSSIDFELVFHFLGPDFNAHMDARQAVLLALFRNLNDAGVGFAYPTRTVRLVGPEKPSTSRESTKAALSAELR